YILLLLNTFLYTLIFDKPRIQLLNLDQYDTALLITLAALFNLVLFYLLMLSKWVFIIINPVLFYIGSVGAVYADKFHLDTTEYSATKFLLHNTIKSSISENTTYTVFITLMFLLGLAFGFIRFFFARDKSVIRRGQVFAVIFLISVICYTNIYNNFNQFVLQPYAFFKSVKNYTISYLSYKFSANIRQDKINAVKTDDNITGIVILLDKLANTPFKETSSQISSGSRIIILDNVKTDYANNYSTRSAVLTGAAAENINDINNSKSFISMFQNAGYNVEYFAVYNSLLSKDALAYNIVKNDTKNITEKYTNNSPNLFTSLAYIKKFTSKNNGGLFIVNAEGSAPLISMRYKDFINNNTSGDEYSQYIDYIYAYLLETTELLKDRKAFIVLQGLEGEKYNNGLSANKDSTSAMIIWVSEKLNQKYSTADIIYAHKNDIVLDDTLFNTLSGCFQMDNAVSNNGRNLCRKN
ncbi:MAG: hypothetical protein K2N11_08290, partial [Mucispirillum sp.]|nr:hypothetical protein [Mucispirillum sp.]